MIKIHSILFLLAILGYDCSQGLAATQPCPNSAALVTFHAEEDYQIVCQAVELGITFMQANGFRMPSMIRIAVVDEVTGNHAAGVYGQYSALHNQIEMLGIQKFMAAAEGRKVFGVTADKDIFRSFIIHEVAHAVAQSNFRLEAPPGIAQEYIAYVVQLATLPAAVLQKVLDGFRFKGFASEREITSIYYGLSPDNFAVKSYLHFAAHHNSKAFISRLLNEDVLDRCVRQRTC